MGFGTNLKRLRETAGLSQLELGARAGGINPTRISAMERDEDANPTRETIEALARGLGCRQGELLDGADVDKESRTQVVVEE